MFAKKLFKTMNDKQITVFIAIKRRPNFSIINNSFNFCCSLKTKSILQVSKIYKGKPIIWLWMWTWLKFWFKLSHKNQVSVPVSVVYSFSMHKNRHAMTSVTAEQCETTVFAYCWWSEGAVLIKSASPTLPLHSSILKQTAIRSTIYKFKKDNEYIVTCSKS